MTKLVADETPGSNVPVYSVTDLAKQVKGTLEERYSHIRVRGEISQPKLHTPSGHLYLRLKDEGAVLEAVCWRGVMAKIGIKPEEGLEVICTGRISSYPGRSQYQLIIENMALAGVGALLKMLEERRQKLAAEGLFADSRKQALPTLPRVIGVITSPTGAVIRDILHRLTERMPVHVLLWPVAVQGSGAAEQIAAAIAGFNALPANGPANGPASGVVPRPDLLIVARGGGSLEDLWAFNEEVVVRAAAASEIPLISAVGHETDTTLIDFAADRRAPTPTAAAEIAVPVRQELLTYLQAQQLRLMQAWQRLSGEKRLRLQASIGALIGPRALLENAMQRLDDKSSQLKQSWHLLFARRGQGLSNVVQRLRQPREFLSARREALLRQGQKLLVVCQAKTQLPVRLERVQQSQHRLQQAWLRVQQPLLSRLVVASSQLESLSYTQTLKRGFVLVRNQQGDVVQAAADVTSAQKLVLQFADGVANVIAEGPKKSTSRKAVQDSLF